MITTIFHPGPKHSIDEARPAVFLAGPIQGAPDWQAEALAHLEGIDADVFSPRSLGPVPEYYVQVAWERAHLRRAGRNGVVMFWLCKPYPLSWKSRLRILATGIPSRAHAQTSRLELGWELARNVMADPSHGARGSIVVGMEPGFSNERFIRRMVTEEAGRGPVYDTLADTCDAVRRVLSAPRAAAA